MLPPPALHFVPLLLPRLLQLQRQPMLLRYQHSSPSLASQAQPPWRLTLVKHIRVVGRVAVVRVRIAQGERTQACGSGSGSGSGTVT